MKVKARGIYYHVDLKQDSSSKPNLLLLHGFMGSGKIFDALISELTDIVNPITIDLMGHSQSEGFELHYQFSAKEQLAGLADVINQISEGPIILYGYSMGARLALLYALSKKKNLLGLILESGTFGIENEQERLSRQELDAKRADRIMGDYSGFLEDWAKMPIMNNSTDDKLNEIQAKQNPLWMANSLLGFGSGTMPNLRHELGSISTPVLLTAGEKDSKFCRINQKMNQLIPNSDLSIIKKSGHRIHSEQPALLALEIRNFITNKLAL